MKPTNENLVEALRESPAVKAHLEAQAKVVAAKRRDLVAARAKLSEEAGAAYIRECAFVDTTRKAVYAAQAALLDAQRKHSTASGQRLITSDRLDRGDREFVIQLIETASPEIPAFIERMWAEWEKALKAPPESDVSATKNMVTGQREVTAKLSRVVQPKERAVAIRAAIDAAEAMKLEADQDDVPARLTELEAALPVIGAPR